MFRCRQLPFAEVQIWSDGSRPNYPFPKEVEKIMSLVCSRTHVPVCNKACLSTPHLSSLYVWRSVSPKIPTEPASSGYWKNFLMGNIVIILKKKNRINNFALLWKYNPRPSSGQINWVLVSWALGVKLLGAGMLPKMWEKREKPFPARYAGKKEPRGFSIW